MTLEEALVIIANQAEQIKILMERIKTLEAQLNMNSSNSSKPPSTDGFKKNSKDRSLREKSGKPSGGQLGHKGSTLEQVKVPDKTVVIEHNTCPHCLENIQNIEVDESKTRQVFDIPEIKIHVTEYKTHSKICPHCKKKSSSEFGKEAPSFTSYGPNIRALILNWSNYQTIPYARLAEMLSDMFGHKISEGTILNIMKEAASNLEAPLEKIKEELINGAVLHADESGMYAIGKRYWVFVYSNLYYTFVDFHKNRGKKALEENGIIAKFKGILSHDCWYAYDTYTHILHALCNAHLLRELNGIQENDGFLFSKRIKEILLEMKKNIDEKRILSDSEKMRLYCDYLAAINDGFAEEKIKYPFNPYATKKARSKAYNLLKRLNRVDDVLRFFLEENLEVFDNNQAERDIRGVKIKQNVSGTFRSEKGAKYYCAIRSYISTMKKNGLPILDALRSIFDTREIIMP